MKNGLLAFLVMASPVWAAEGDVTPSTLLTAIRERAVELSCNEILSHTSGGSTVLKISVSLDTSNLDLQLARGTLKRGMSSYGKINYDAHETPVKFRVAADGSVREWSLVEGGEFEVGKFNYQAELTNSSGLPRLMMKQYKNDERGQKTDIKVFACGMANTAQQ